MISVAKPCPSTEIFYLFNKDPNITKVDFFNASYDATFKILIRVYLLYNIFPGVSYLPSDPTYEKLQSIQFVMYLF